MSSVTVYDYNSPYGESCYRLMTRTGDFIYLRTRGYLDIDRDTNQVRSFVCVNALVEEEEGKRLVKEMKKKFTIMIQETEISSNEPDEAAVENPVQLERAIISLITNLHHGTGTGTEMVESPETQGSTDGHESDTNRSVKSPPLEIIPPKTSSIKTSIVNSMDVMNATLKHMQKSSIEIEDDKTTVKKSTKIVRTSVVQRNANAKLCNEASTSNRSKSNASSSCSSPPKTMSTTTTTTTIITTTNHMQVTQSHCVSSGLTSTETTLRNLNDNLDIKQEQPDSFEDSRVPPLPTNAGYFEMSPYNSQQYIDDISSPLECKPFDFLGFDPLQVQQADESRFLTPETAAQYQQYDTGDHSNRPISNLNDTLNQPANSSGIKRSCSSENLNCTNKRRYYEVPQNNINDDNDGNENDAKLSLSLHQTCIDQLTDPGQGIFELMNFFTKICMQNPFFFLFGFVFYLFFVFIKIKSTNCKMLAVFLASGTGLEDTLPSSFDVLDQALMEIHDTASELRDQGTTYSNQQLNEILVRKPVFSYLFFEMKTNFFFFDFRQINSMAIKISINSHMFAPMKLHAHCSLFSLYLLNTVSINIGGGQRAKPNTRQPTTEV